MVKDADFGVVLSTLTEDASATRTASIDFIRMTVYYTAPACSPNITTIPTIWAVNGGSPVVVSSNYSTGLTYFNVTNSSGGPINISIGGTNMTGGGYTWVLSDTATAGDMIYGLKAGLSGSSYNITVKLNSPYNTLVGGLPSGAGQLWGLELSTPTIFSDQYEKSGTVILTASCA